MPLAVQCPGCASNLKVPDTAAGKRVKCPKCAGVIAVPGAPAGQIAAGPPQAPQPAAPPPLPSAQIQPQYQQPAAPQQPVYYQQPQAPQYPAQQYPPQQYPPQQYPPQQYPPQQYQDPNVQVYDQGQYPPEEDYDEEGRPRKKKKKGTRSEWMRVRSGVTLVLAGVLVIIGVVILVFCGSFFVVSAALSTTAQTLNQAQQGNPNAAMSGAAAGATTLGYGMIALMIFAGVGYLTSVVLTVIGNIFCMAAPEAAGGRVLALTSLALLCVAVVMQLVATLIQVFTIGLAASGQVMFMPQGMNAASITHLIGNLAFFAHLIVFQLLLRALAVAMRRSGLAGSILAMMIVGGIGILAFFGVFIFILLGVGGAAAAGGGQGSRDIAAMGGILGVMSGCTFVLLMFTWFIWYIITLFMMRATISEKIG